jgi:hypothetical protein
MDTKARAWTWALTVFIVTFTYLIFELSFSSELLNIVGQKASTADINSIEHWGRYLSGFAAGLVLWSVFTPTRFIIFPVNFSVKSMLFLNIILTCLVAGVVYHYEMDYVHNAKSENSGTLRKDAVYASFIRTGLLNGTIKLTGMPKNTADYHTPEGKAFIALLPLLASSDSNLSGKITGVLPDLVKDNTTVESGGPRKFYNTVFLPTAHKMVAEWVNYQRDVAQLNAGYTRASHEPAYVARSVINNADTVFNTSVRGALATPEYQTPKINPQSIHTMQEFYANPVVIQYWADMLHMPYYRQVMLPNETYSAIKNTVWNAYLNKVTSRQLKSFESNTGKFKDGQPYASQGENAMVLLTVPALALILSVLGMMVHAGKSLYYIQKVVGIPSNILKFIIAVGLFVAIGMFFYTATNVITQASLYHHLSTEYAHNPAKFWPAYWLTWVIQAEKYVYPLADGIRNTLLFGYHFGVTPHV